MEKIFDLIPYSTIDVPIINQEVVIRMVRSWHFEEARRQGRLKPWGLHVQAVSRVWVQLTGTIQDIESYLGGFECFTIEQLTKIH